MIVPARAGWTERIDRLMSGKLFVVVGGAYGSEGKGAVAGRICADMGAQGRNVVCVRVGGPNAGHTVMGLCPEGCEDHGLGEHPWRLRQVPVAAVTWPKAALVIAAGSEVDETVLLAELDALDSAGYRATQRLVVDRMATLLEPAHIEQEVDRGLNTRIGSTAKGIGAARADRIWRSADLWESVGGDPQYAADTAPILAAALRSDSAVVIEGTQGYGLGLHTDNYPYTTSGDCRAIDFLAQAGISPWMRSGPFTGVDLKIVVCLRPYPIRVAGNSGELKGETTWDELGLPEEHTTVTQKVRRVGEWDADLAIAALAANGGPREGVVWVALTMMDSVESVIAGAHGQVPSWRAPNTPKSAHEHMRSLGLTTSHLGYVGTGPDSALVNREMYA